MFEEKEMQDALESVAGDRPHPHYTSTYHKDPIETLAKLIEHTTSPHERKYAKGHAFCPLCYMKVYQRYNYCMKCGCKLSG